MISKNKLTFSKGVWLVHVLAPSIFILTMVLYHPFRETFQYDPDEGLNLIKTALVREGHQITGDIQTDQPPLLSNLLAFIFRWTGQSVNVGRMVVLMFSALLMGAAGMASLIAWGRSTSKLVYLTILMLPFYLKLSVSVMVGQPSIALAMVALLCLFVWHRYRKWPWLVLTGLCMSLSLFMKLFTAFILPIFGIGLLVSEWVILNGSLKKKQGVNWSQLLGPAFVFSISVIGFSGLLAIAMLDMDNVSALVTPHLDARHLMSKKVSISFYLKSAKLILWLAGLGLGYSVVKQKWLALYPAAWAATAYLLLLGHNPIWSHHQMLITIPAAMLAAFGTYSIIEDFWERSASSTLWIKTLVLSGLLLVGASLSKYPPNVWEQMNNRTPSFKSYGLDPDSGEMLILKRMQPFIKEGVPIVTDMPMFAFRANMLVPIDLAWVSSKKMNTGLLTEQDFIDVIERDNPTLILIARYKLDEVRAYLADNANYEEVISTKIHTERKATLYSRIEP